MRKNESRPETSGRLHMTEIGPVPGLPAFAAAETAAAAFAAEAAGARIALFGRKINYAERPLALVALMRRVIARELTPEQAVVAYHDDLVANDCPPTLALADDMKITEPTLLADD